MQVSNLRLRAGTASIIRRWCRRLEPADTIRGVSHGPGERAARCAQQQSSLRIGDNGSSPPSGLRRRRRRILVASTRFGASTCSCAPAGSGAISFTQPDSCTYTNTGTGSYTSAIAEPDAGSCASSDSNAYPRTSTHG